LSFNAKLPIINPELSAAQQSEIRELLDEGILLHASMQQNAFLLMPAIKGDMYINTHCNYSQPTLIKLYNENIGEHLTPLHICPTYETFIT